MVVYLSFLDVQPTPPSGSRLRVFQENFSTSLACPGAVKPREGTILPPLVSWPLFVSFDASVAIAVTADSDRPIQQVVLLAGEVEYMVRFLLVAAAPGPIVSTNPGSDYVAAVSIANDAQSIKLLDNIATIDMHAHALATFMALDKTVLLLSSLALAETGPGRVRTTCECKDLLYPVSPLAALVRAICRVYLMNDIIGGLRPILAELCAGPLSTKSLVDQTSFASLAVRLSTAAIEIVTSRMPLPFVVAVEEAFRLNLPEVPTGPLVGAFFTASLVSASVVFANEFQLEVSPESLGLLTRAHSAVVQALVASVDSSVEVASDLQILVHGLGSDIRNKSAGGFNSLVANCADPGPVGAIERVNEPRILDQAAAVLLLHNPQVAIPTVLPTTTPAPSESPFLQLLDDFKARAFALKANHAIHPFHQYHLQHYSFGTHFNPNGPTFDSTARSARRSCRDA